MNYFYIIVFSVLSNLYIEIGEEKTNSRFDVFAALMFD